MYACSPIFDVFEHRRSHHNVVVVLRQRIIFEIAKLDIGLDSLAPANFLSHFNQLRADF